MNRRLMRVHACEIQVPVLQPKDAANRFPDLIILRPEHLELTQRRLTITRNMPPPCLIAEIVSLGKTNRDRDYIHKRAQYATIGGAEYWLIDPETQTAMVLSLADEDYREVGIFAGSESIASVELAALDLTIAQIFDSTS